MLAVGQEYDAVLSRVVRSAEMIRRNGQSILIVCPSGDGKKLEMLYWFDGGLLRSVLISVCRQPNRKRPEEDLETIRQFLSERFGKTLAAVPAEGVPYIWRHESLDVTAGIEDDGTAYGLVLSLESGSALRISRTS